MKTIIYLQGGLGNQMFQYAFFLSMAAKYQRVTYNTAWYNVNTCHNGFELQRLFGIPPQGSQSQLLLLRAIRRLKHLGIQLAGINLVQDTIPTTYRQYRPSEHVNLFDGYWQSEKFFAAITEHVRKTFQWDLSQLNSKSHEILSKINNSKAAISLHVRRGDYLAPEASDLYTGICTESYYSKAISRIKSEISDATFFVFSDDIQWAKENLPLKKAIFVDHNRRLDSWQDMLLMSQCDHNIIANSSFSWWGAWLNPNPRKIVITPSRFLNIGNNADLIPSVWLKI